MRLNLFANRPNRCLVRRATEYKAGELCFLVSEFSKELRLTLRGHHSNSVFLEHASLTIQAGKFPSHCNKPVFFWGGGWVGGLAESLLGFDSCGMED